MKMFDRLKEKGLWGFSVHTEKAVEDVPELVHVDIAVVATMFRDFAMDRLGAEVANQVAERYVEEHYQELIAKLDMDALVKQLGVSIGMAIVEKVLPRDKS